MKNAKDDDEVEQLLQAAQDEILIKLSIDSHSSRSHPNHLHPDLNSRFLTLKSSQKPRSNDIEETPDDLLLRFSALKGSIPPSSSSVSIPDKIGEDDDEVEKVIQWAIDAARLDPSPLSDDEDSQNSDDENDFTKDAKP